VHVPVCVRVLKRENGRESKLVCDIHVRMDMNTHTYVYVCRYVYVYIYVRPYVRPHVRLCICTCVQVYTGVSCMYVCVCMCVCVYVCVYACVCVSVYMQARIYHRINAPMNLFIFAFFGVYMHLCVVMWNVDIYVRKRAQGQEDIHKCITIRPHKRK